MPKHGAFRLRSYTDNQLRSKKKEEALKRKTDPFDSVRRTELRNANNFDRGIPRMDIPIVATGRVLFNPFSPGSMCLMTRKCVLHCIWFAKEIPPDIRNGDRITILGQLLTGNLGTRFYLADVIAIPSDAHLAKKKIRAILEQYALKPNNYMERPLVREKDDGR